MDNIHNDIMLLHHYNKERLGLSEKYDEAKREENAMLQSFKRYFPFNEGDIIMNGGEISMVGKFKHVHFRDKEKEIVFVFEKHLHESYNFRSSPNTQTISLNELDNWTLLKSHNH